MKLIPLHIYSEYSFLQSGLTLDKFATLLQKEGIRYLSSTDESFLYAFPSIKRLAKEHNLQPIYGMDFHYKDLWLTFFVRNEEGYRNLLKISNSKKEDIDDAFLSKTNNGLQVVLHSKSFENVTKMRAIFNHFYIGLEYLDENATKVRAYAEENQIEILAYPHIRYLTKKDAIVLDIATAISQNKTLNYKEKEGEDYLHSDDEYAQFYLEKEIQNCENFVKNLNFELTKKRGEIIRFASSSKDLLEEKVMEGKKYRGLDGEIYEKRLRYELDVIHQMQYDDYFLIVADYVHYAKTHDIAVGPGRGSAAGSLVSYVLGITEVDPIPYSLYFERFLNPMRQSMPDIDIDFEDIKREDVVAYLENKYGYEKVARIITYQTIGAKQAIRDIGRVFSYDNFEIDYLSKILGNNARNLRESYKTNSAFKELIDREPHYLEIVSLASKIEGLIRQSSIHAAGIVLNQVALRDVLPVIQDIDGHLITQYEMMDLEEQGFLKMDLLSLRNLTLMKEILSMANSNLSIYDIPRDDQKAIDLISQNKVMGIFQLESSGMQSSIQQLKPSCFEDITALIALFRPGPMKEIPHYAKRKAGLETIDYLNKEMERILAPTYGIIIYQEQIMQIVTSMAGLSLAQSDLFRRAISKKDAKKLESLKNEFFLGCKKKGYSLEETEQVYEHISRFADYGFNRNHSVGYAVIVTQMAYLKAHFPLYFYAVMLQNEKGTPKFKEFLSEIRSLRIPLSLPDIRFAKKECSIYQDKLVFGLSSIKGMQARLIDPLLEERDRSPFTSFFDFVNRCYKLHLNEAFVQTLIEGGALDYFGNRSDLKASIRNAFLQAKNDAIFKNGVGLHYSMVKGNPQPLEDLKKEYELYGVMISGSPLSYKKEQLEAYHPLSISNAKNKKGNRLVTAGILQKIYTIKTKTKQESMAYLTLLDDTSEMEFVLFPRIYQDVQSKLKLNQIVVVTYSTKIYQEQLSYYVESLIILED